ncbi:hypothetical protein [Phytoactinopolyspora mesophila]|uniref:Uncharacterized protein n=1 Tax=Phytoactinopolyspora mesophila TaxID=2650750 RepID=A0A7K3LYX4_9ACTN|nr:hypothetical protein [Phytoactinopolyspora mesophila]NDL56224.1 hypothetical protein [Phytoactinopolyspora mesophila]
MRDRWDDVDVSDLPIPRTREDLAARLDALGVHGGSFHLFGARGDDAFVMDQRPDGWVVFYSERGHEHDLARYDNEADACADLLTRVTGEEHVFFELVAGPAPEAEADAAFDAWLGRRGIYRRDLGPGEWKFDDVPWVAGPYWRRYFVRITTIRRLGEAR